MQVPAGRADYTPALPSDQLPGTAASQQAATGSAAHVSRDGTWQENHLAHVPAAQPPGTLPGDLSGLGQQQQGGEEQQERGQQQCTDSGCHESTAEGSCAGSTEVSQEQAQDQDQELHHSSNSWESLHGGTPLTAGFQSGEWPAGGSEQQPDVEQQQQQQQHLPPPVPDLDSSEADIPGYTGEHQPAAVQPLPAEDQGASGTQAQLGQQEANPLEAAAGEGAESGAPAAAQPHPAATDDTPQDGGGKDLVTAPQPLQAEPAAGEVMPDTPQAPAPALPAQEEPRAALDPPQQQQRQQVELGAGWDLGATRRLAEQVGQLQAAWAGHMEAAAAATAAAARGAAPPGWDPALQQDMVALMQDLHHSLAHLQPPRQEAGQAMEQQVDREQGAAWEARLAALQQEAAAAHQQLAAAQQAAAEAQWQVAAGGTGAGLLVAVLLVALLAARRRAAASSRHQAAVLAAGQQQSQAESAQHTVRRLRKEGGGAGGHDTTCACSMLLISCVPISSPAANWWVIPSFVWLA